MQIEQLLRERVSLRGICRAVGVSLTWLLHVMVECFTASYDQKLTGRQKISDDTPRLGSADDASLRASSPTRVLTRPQTPWHDAK